MEKVTAVRSVLVC